MINVTELVYMWRWLNCIEKKTHDTESIVEQWSSLKLSPYLNVYSNSFNFIQSINFKLNYKAALVAYIVNIHISSVYTYLVSDLIQ